MSETLALQLLAPVKKVLYDYIADYVSHVASCDTNLDELHKKLEIVSSKKEDIEKKVKIGRDKNEKITREAAIWLNGVRNLTQEEEMKGLMMWDVETAKHVVSLMGKKELKMSVVKDGEMQKVVIKVMKKLHKELEKKKKKINDEGGEMLNFIAEDYRRVAEVVVEVMKETTEEFKNRLKKDREIAVLATKMLTVNDLHELTKDDQEMEEVIAEAIKMDENNNEGQQTAPVLVDGSTDKNKVRKAANELFSLMANLITPLGKIMADENFKAVVPEAESIKLGLDVFDSLFLRGGKLINGMNDDEDDDKNSIEHRYCCCGQVSACNFHDRYRMSVAAEAKADYIQKDILDKCPGDPVTLPIRPADYKPIPTEFNKGLKSRNVLLEKILEKLKDNQVHALGIFGMGGAGKTTLATEVKRRATEMFDITVMVEVSNAPDILSIQDAIAESMDLPLHDLHDVAQRAIRLYNRLILEKENRILIILDNIWKKLNIHQGVGIPPNCKLLLTTREKEVCRVMGVQDVNIFEVGVLDPNEARDLFKSQVGNKETDREYKTVVDELLSKCGGLPLTIVAVANALKNKDLITWKKFVDMLSKPVSSQIEGVHHDTYKIMETSIDFIESQEKKMFFLLACLSPIGSSVSIEDLMRYGIGIGLFQHADKLSEVMEQANKWSRELVLSSMLLESDTEGHVQIHDVVRASAIFFVPKGCCVRRTDTRS